MRGRPPLGVAIIGPGKAAELQARALAGVADARLVAIVGRNAERAGQFAARHGTRGVVSMGEAVDGGAEAVIVCTPHPMHAEHSLQAIEFGLHVLVEKPLALTSADADRMIGAAREGGVLLGAMAQRRWYPPARRIKEAIDAGRIGRPALAEVVVLGWRGAEYYAMDAWRGTWAREGGGVLVNQAVHQLDLMTWFMGPAAEVYAAWDNVNHPEIEVEDTAVGVVRFANGALGSIVASNSQRPGLYARVHIHGSSGASIGVQTDRGSMFVAGVTTGVEPAINDLWTVPGEEELLLGWQADDAAASGRIDPLTHYHRLQLADFVAAVRDGRPLAVGGEEARFTVELLEALYRSQELGTPIHLRPSPGPRSSEER
jgi:UDP-N-acetyl-2-amino-2-deoxyglucuronate dehydrogenase